MVFSERFRLQYHHFANPAIIVLSAVAHESICGQLQWLSISLAHSLISFVIYSISFDLPFVETAFTYFNQ
jgi:hypothetical protein